MQFSGLINPDSNENPMPLALIVMDSGKMDYKNA